MLTFQPDRALGSAAPYCTKVWSNAPAKSASLCFGKRQYQGFPRQEWSLMGKLWQPAGLSVLTEFALGCAVGRGLNLSARISPDLVFDATTAFSPGAIAPNFTGAAVLRHMSRPWGRTRFVSC